VLYRPGAGVSGPRTSDRRTKRVSTRLTFTSIHAAAAYRWPGILVDLGISSECLRDRHGPCPGCGGRDRFRFDDRDGRGTFLCGGGGELVAGDGFRLLEHVHGWSGSEALRQVARVLGLEGPHGFPERSAPARQTKAAAQAERAARERRERQKAASAHALACWCMAHDCGSHPYLEAKRLPAIGVRVSDYRPHLRDDGTVCRVLGPWLIVPLRLNDPWEIVNLECIHADGRKRPVTGAPKAGTWGIAGEGLPGDHVILAEGYATALALHVALQEPVVFVGSCGNFPAVAQRWRAWRPHARFTFAADRDENGAGLEATRRAGRAVAATIRMPKRYDDWADAYLDEGPDYVRRCFADG
jgi:putative DNA primase/helicase